MVCPHGVHLGGSGHEMYRENSRCGCLLGGMLSRMQRPRINVHIGRHHGKNRLFCGLDRINDFFILFFDRVRGGDFESKGPCFLSLKSNSRDPLFNSRPAIQEKPQ